MYCRKCGIKQVSGICPNCAKTFFASRKFAIPVILIFAVIAGIITFVFIRLSNNLWDYLTSNTYNDKFYEMYINTKSLLIKDNRVYFWQKTIPSKNLSIPYSCSSYDMSYVVLDCNNDSIQTLRSVSYDESGNNIEQTSNIEDVFEENNVIPESIGEDIKNNVCKNLNPVIRLKNLIISKNRSDNFADCE